MGNNIGLPLATEKYFSDDECGRIIEMSQRLPEMDGVAGYKGQAKHLRESRIKSIAPENDNAWLYQKLQKAVVSANQQYNFDISGFHEGLQVAQYTAGGHFDWHLDIGTEVTADRKLSVSVQLSGSDDYSGGDLEFFAVENQRIPRGLGDIIIFPTYLAHRITPVIDGVRWSLVAWVHGPAFR